MKKNIETENYKFFQHKDCEYFPCHDVKNIENFNCIFCYCPLYALGDKCGGNFKFTDNAIKNCTYCTIPHRKENYDLIIDRMKGILELAKKKD